MEDLEILSIWLGHRVNFRKVIETEIFNYEQGLQMPGRQQHQSGRKAAPAPKAVDVKVAVVLRGTRPVEEAPAREKQSKYIIKVTFDARQISKIKAEVMQEQHLYLPLHRVRILFSLSCRIGAAKTGTQP